MARLLHDFQIEFAEPTPAVETLAERYERLLRAGEMTVLIAETWTKLISPASPSSASGPGSYSDGLHAYLEELYVVPASRARASAGPCWRCAIETARERGSDTHGVGHERGRHRGPGLYESAGFTNRERGARRAR